MTLRNCGIGGLACVWVLTALVMPVRAQENLDKGKTAAQLFASDCAICHKSPSGLGKVGGLFGLDNFLRVHYTASRESAEALAKYLQAVGNAPDTGSKRTRRSAKSSDKETGRKTTQSKSSKDKDTKPAEAKVEPKSEPSKEIKETPKTGVKAESTPDPKPEPKAEKKSEPQSAPKSEKSD